MNAEHNNAGPEALISPRETAILDAIRRIRYGSVEVVIHDGQIVQIERTEKVRIGLQG
jgi:hypothetical protein